MSFEAEQLKSVSFCCLVMCWFHLMCNHRHHIYSLVSTYTRTTKRIIIINFTISISDIDTYFIKDNGFASIQSNKLKDDGQR